MGGVIYKHVKQGNGRDAGGYMGGGVKCQESFNSTKYEHAIQHGLQTHRLQSPNACVGLLQEAETVA